MFTTELRSPLRLLARRRRDAVCGLLRLALVLLAGAIPLSGALARTPEPGVELTPAERVWLDEHADEVVVDFNTDFPPFEYESESGEFIGLGADVMKLVEERLGVRFSRRRAPSWTEHLARLEDGTSAIAPTIVRTEERVRFAAFTKYYVRVPIVIVTSRATETELTLADLKKLRTGVVAGFATERHLAESPLGPFETQPVPDVASGLRAVSFGQLDAFVCNLAVAAYTIEKESLPNLRVAGEIDYHFELRIAVSRKYPELFRAIDKALNAIPPEEIAALRTRWIVLQDAPRLSEEARRLIGIVALFVALLLLGLTVITLILKRRLDDKVRRLREAQAKLREHRERLDLASGAVGTRVWEFDAVADRFVQTAPGAHTSPNPAPSIDGTLEDWRALIHPEDRPHTQAARKAYFASGGEGLFEAEFRMRQPDGSWRWMLSIGRTIERGPGGEPARLIGLTLDIQILRETQERLTRSEARSRALFERAPLALARVSHAGALISFNERFEELFGYTVEDMPNLAEWWIRAYPDPAHRLQVQSAWNAAVDAAFATGASVPPEEYDVTCKNGRTRSVVIEANIVGEELLVSFFDISQRKRAERERERLNEQLIQSQKMEAVGVLAGGVAHDFNNNLGAIIGYTELAIEDAESPAETRAHLAEILAAGHRSGALTRQLLAFARRQEVAPIVIEINPAIESLLKMLRRLIGENIELVWQPGWKPGCVKMDPSQLDQLLTNLCVNARDAIGDVGKVVIETENRRLEASDCSEISGAEPGEHVVITISDDGCGMDEATMKHVFEPFFTTKGVGQGTGLGLSTVYGIVRQNGGFIDLSSDCGGGTTFRIHLPCDRTALEPASAGNDSPEPSRLRETILMVEDDPALLTLGQMILSRMGHEVLLANSPSAALEHARQRGDQIGLVISDVIMPEMNGRELAEQLREHLPRSRQLFMSGYTADAIAERGVLEEGVHFIQKPFSSKELARKLDEVLSQK